MLNLTIAVVVAGAVFAAAYAFVIEPAWRLRTRRYRVAPAAWSGGPTLRVAALTDFHAGSPYMSVARLRRIVAQANALDADLILLLGDFLAKRRWWCRPLPPEQIAAMLAELRAPLGTFAILGNHDFADDADGPLAADGPLPRIAGLLEDRGIRVLENTAVRLVHGSCPFWIAGLGDQRAEKIPGGGYCGRDDLARTIACVADPAPAILLAHEPDIHPRVPSRIALTLSGHTHAGQVRLFGWSPITPSDFGNRFAYGHIIEGGRHIIVSAGLGLSLMPVRFGAVPEIVIVEIAPPDQRPAPL